MVPLPANSGVAAPAARPIMPAKNNIPQDRTMPPSSAPHSLAALFLAPLLLAGAFVLPLAGAQAQSIERLGDFSDWSAFKYEESGNLVCFMASEPAKAEGNYTARGKIHAMVTHRPGEQRTDEVSIQAGYVYKQTSPVEVDVGGLKVRLFTEGDSAWTVDKACDKTQVQAMIQGRTNVVTGTSPP